MGCLALGYLAAMVGGGSRARDLPPVYVPPAAPAPASAPASPLPPPGSEPPPAPIPYAPPADGLGEYPAWNGVDLDCKDIRRPVRVPGRDPHRLDHDGNGVGCESY